MSERRGTNWTKENDEFMERMHELDRQTVRENQLEREGVNKLNWYRETHKEDKKTIENLQSDREKLQSRHNELLYDRAKLQTENDDLKVERDSLLARVAELEKGVQEGGDLVE